MTRRPYAALLLATLAASPALAQEPKLPDVKAFDKLVVDTLRDVHNLGADLYNEKKQPEAAYRMYQGALMAVRPLLAHRPAAQKLIDDGFAAAEKESVVALKAFKLHETIEGVRAHLKNPDAKPSGPADPKNKEKEPGDPKLKDKTDTKGKPDTKTSGGGNAKAPTTSTVSGIVTLQGKPLAAAEVTVVTLDEAKPRVFTAAIQPDGTYQFKEPLPAGKYVVIVTAPAVPAKYQTTTTSGLVIEVKPGANAQNIELK
jgi:hypothetical protein